MIVLFILYVLFCFAGCKFTGSKFNRNYISKENTTAVNGIFTGLIIFGHFVQYYTEYSSWDTPYIEVRSFLGQMVVSLFFIYSGYGIFESCKAKGDAYITSFPKNRIPKIILHLDLAVLIFTGLFLLTGREVGFLKFMLSLIGWEYIGNNNWFIFATLVFYLITFVSVCLFKGRKVLVLSAITVLTVVYILVIQNFKPTFWYNSALCYPFGMWFSYFKEKIDSAVMKNNLAYFITLFALLGLFIGARFFWGGFGSLITYLISCILFGFLFIVLTMKLNFRNKALEWIGKHAFSIYMLQRIPMILLYDMGILPKYPHMCFVVSFGVTLAVSALFDKATGFIDKKVFIGKKAVT